MPGLATAACLLALAAAWPASAAAQGVEAAVAQAAPQLPDGRLHGVVRMTWDLSREDRYGGQAGYCEGIGILSLDPQTFIRYPLGEWRTLGGSISILARMQAEWERPNQPRRTFSLAGADSATAALRIKTEDEGSYEFAFSSDPIAVTVNEQAAGRAPVTYENTQCSLAMSVGKLPLPAVDEAFSGSYRDPDGRMSVDWDFWPDPCAANAAAPEDADARALAAAVADAFDDGVVTPGHVHARQGDSLQLPRFTLRLSADGCLLPAARDAQLACSASGATEAVFGAVRQSDDRSDVTVRAVSLATGELRAAGRGAAAGTDPEALRAAVAEAIGELGLAPSCAAGSSD